MNTGAEAVETALKAARKWGYEVKGVPEDKAEIIVCANNFHGRTDHHRRLLLRSADGDGFGPFTPGFKVDPVRRRDALRDGDHAAYSGAFLVEPIQGEAGIVIPPAGYLAAGARICREQRVLLLADEIQTGPGPHRPLPGLTSTRASRPDGSSSARRSPAAAAGVGGGRDRRGDTVFRPGEHGSTFGGNPLACAGARGPR